MGRRYTLDESKGRILIIRFLDLLQAKFAACARDRTGKIDSNRLNSVSKPVKLDPDSLDSS